MTTQGTNSSRHLLATLALWTLALVRAAAAGDAAADSACHWGAAVTLHPNRQLGLDEWVRDWLYDTEAVAFNVELLHSAVPADSLPIDADYGYPTIAVGLRYGDNHRVTMQKPRTTDYFSHLGNTLTLYGTFARPLLRTRHWEADYTLGTGVGYSRLIYNKTNDVDNELIGSHLLIYFNAGLHLTYHPTPDFGLKAGVEFCHHSNGAMARPNKGANSLGPSLTLVYTPYYAATIHQSPSTIHQSPSTFLDLSVGVGGKTLLEDWHRTQFRVPKTDPEYLTEDFTFYMAYSLHARWMARYARRWASGVGADVFYGSYSSHLRRLDEEAGSNVPHSPWSVGLSANHTAYYHDVSLQMAVGYYLYREMGVSAKEIEKPYYERIGLHYTPRRLGGLTVGISLNAHLTKADFTELVVSYPVRL